MRVILAGIAAAIVLGAVAALVLRTAQDPVYQVFSAPSVRVGDPGSNLIGRAWTGNPSVPTREAGNEARAGAN